MNKSPKKAKCTTAQELCSLTWNAPAGENLWESPDGTTGIWRCCGAFSEVGETEMEPSKVGSAPEQEGARRCPTT